MYGITASERSAIDQLLATASSSHTGEHWERRTHTLLPEINCLIAVHPGLRQSVSLALLRLAEADQTHQKLDIDTIAQVTTVLDALNREGGFELRRWASDLREEFALARGRTVAQALARGGADPVTGSLPRQNGRADGLAKL